jgi:signal transduction histidine kinase
VTNGPSLDTHARKSYEVARLRLARTSAAGGDALARPVAEACEIAASTLDVERVGIWLFVDGGSAIRCFHLLERSNHARSEGAVLRRSEIPTYFKALMERSHICADDARTDPITRELAPHYLEPLGITSMLDAPIYFAGEVRGVVCHEHVGAPRSWTLDQRNFACSVADKLALLGEEAARRDAELRAALLSEHVVELERTKALTRLAAGAAHDVRSLVNVVRWAARAIADDPQKSSSVGANVERILAATDSVMTITRDLETVGRASQEAPKVIDADAEVRRLLPVMRAAAGDACTVELRANGSGGLLLMDPGQLERLLLNLVINARDAMPGGGTVVVEVGEATVEEDEVMPAVFTAISVADSGMGISPEVRAHVFEPFFTTKRREMGTGLGLAVVHSVAERYGGFVHVDSEVGRGTTFRVYLPRVSATASAPAG